MYLIWDKVNEQSSFISVARVGYFNNIRFLITHLWLWPLYSFIYTSFCSDVWNYFCLTFAFPNRTVFVAAISIYKQRQSTLDIYKHFVEDRAQKSLTSKVIECWGPYFGFWDFLENALFP